jgi:hypothetical protein
MPVLTYFPQSDLPPEIECQILSFLRIHWPDGFEGENRLRGWITRIDFHPVSYVLLENGLLIAHAQVVWKLLEHAGETYLTYGLTGVFTYPSFRGQGYGLEVIRAASQAITHSGADIGMFHCSPALGRFYALAGWTPMEGAVTYVGTRDAPVQVDELMMMQFFSEKGQRGRETFLSIPVFFDEDTTW